jgi:hypothetical protein
MWILVARRTTLVREGPVEIAVFMTTRAGEFSVLPNQSEFCTVVVEARACVAAFPAAGVVAALA